MSSDITGAMFSLGTELAKYPERGDLNRALVLRRALCKVRDDGWDDGYRDGMADGRDRREKPQ